MVEVAGIVEAMNLGTVRAEHDARAKADELERLNTERQEHIRILDARIAQTREFEAALILGENVARKQLRQNKPVMKMVMVRRFEREILWVAFGGCCWLAMMAVHEAGHVLGAGLSGGACRPM